LSRAACRASVRRSSRRCSALAQRTGANQPSGRASRTSNGPPAHARDGRRGDPLRRQPVPARVPAFPEPPEAIAAQRGPALRAVLRSGGRGVRHGRPRRRPIRRHGSSRASPSPATKVIVFEPYYDSYAATNPRWPERSGRPVTLRPDGRQVHLRPGGVARPPVGPRTRPRAGQLPAQPGRHRLHPRGSSRRSPARPAAEPRPRRGSPTRFYEYLTYDGAAAHPARHAWTAMAGGAHRLDLVRRQRRFSGDRLEDRGG